MMDDREQLLVDARRAVAELPCSRYEIIDLYRLAISEIEEGESAAHEHELFMGSVDKIRKESTYGH